MSRQDKATTDRNARILRELVKHPDNKSCADCRRNDARWASWNLGVFVCIRCSGIHRSMGTHISRVKSVDLDIWQPEQMEMMQKWGNRLANLFWEKHLKPGHVPPEHKIESFIRSKYESRRWAMSGPQPTDPSVLEEGGGGASPAQVASPPPPAPSSRAPPPAARSAQPQAQQPPSVTRSAHAHPLLSTQPILRSQQPSPSQASQVQPPLILTDTSSPTPQAAAPTPASSSSIFDLDFHSPPPASTPSPSYSNAGSKKNDIMSLFGAPPPPAAAPQPWGGGTGGYGGGGGGMNGLTGGFGGMNMGGGGGAGAPAAAPSQMMPSMNVWGDAPAPVAQIPQVQARPAQQQQPAMQSNIWDSAPASNVWATPSAPSNPAPAAANDPFGDIWK